MNLQTFIISFLVYYILFISTEEFYLRSSSPRSHLMSMLPFSKPFPILLYPFWNEGTQRYQGKMGIYSVVWLILSILFPVPFLIQFSIIWYPFSDFCWALSRCFLMELCTNLRFHPWVVVIVKRHLYVKLRLLYVCTSLSLYLPWIHLPF